VSLSSLFQSSLLSLRSIRTNIYYRNTRATTIQHNFKPNHINPTKMPSLTDINASDNAATSNTASNNTPVNHQDNPRPRFILHLNANQRKEAEAATHSLQRAQAALERHRGNLNGRAARDRTITQPLLDSARAAIRRFNRILHPGGRTREAFEAALWAWGRTLRLMADDAEWELNVELWLEGVAEAMRRRRAGVAL
jgi:hypothetical protein